MRKVKKRLVAVLVVVLVAAAAGRAGAGSEADRCGGSKTKGGARYARSVFACEASALLRAETLDPACIAKASIKITSVFDKAELHGGCVTTDDEGDVRTRVDSERSAAGVLLAPGPTAEARECAAAKMQAVGRHLFDALGCYGKPAARGIGPSAKCLATADARLGSAFAAAEGGGCTVTGDVDAFRGSDEDATHDLVRALSPVCGDAIQGPSQQCEIGDEAACPGLCSRSCVCVLPPVCGDGVAGLPEECDDGNLADGDGCSASCQLENAGATCTGVPAAAGTGINAVFVTKAFTSPLYITAPRLDAGRLFVVERAGYVRILDLADITPAAAPFLDISDLTSTSGERGFLSMAFDPDYEHNGRFFVSYTNLSGDLVLARYEVDGGDPNAADPSTRQELLLIPHPGASNHNGGQVQFGGDGYLYWSMGDGGGNHLNSQDDASMLGKLLRLDVNHASAPFVTVPPTNPGYVDGSGMLEYVWAKGLRNPWRFSFDRVTGDLYIGDVGANSIEEISYAPGTSAGGENYGWNIFEGTSCHNSPCPDPPTGFTMPVHEYAHGGRHCAVIGGYVYRGCAMPGLSGNYFFSDLCSTFVRTFEVASGVATNFTDRSRDAKSTGVFISGVVSWGEDARGEIYLISGGDSIYRIEPD